MIKKIEDSLPKIISYVIIACLIILVIYFALFWYSGFFNFGLLINPEVSGSFGDFTGGFIGTILAFLTVILVWVTYRTQKKELNESHSVLGLQQFETTFFNLLQTQRVIKKSISFNTDDRLTDSSEETIRARTISGEEFFEFAKKDFSNLYNSEGSIVPKITIRQTSEDFVKELMSNNDNIQILVPTPIGRIKVYYKKFFDRYHNYLGHYFRLTYHILNYLNKKKENELNRVDNQEEIDVIKSKYKFYSDILQAQMSSAELFMMFYNGICFPKAKKLIEEFKLLENLAIEDLADKSHHKSLYKNFELKSRYDLIDD